MSIGRILRLLVVGWIVTMVAGAIAAVRTRQQLGPNTDERADEIAASAIFGPLAYKSTARALRGGRLELWYGGGVLDLRDAVLAPEGATLRLRAIFGGGQILVPADWKVVSSVRGLGGLSDVRPVRGRAEDSPELVIEGLTLFGGFAVMSELDEDGAEWLAEMESKRPSTAAVADESPIDALGAEPEMTPAG
jgi:hypothetical protein